jgi:RHS repeat-associated protein
VPDLHGNVVAAIGPDATFVNAYRYDPYGQTVATWTATTGSVKMPWRYQGRILESAGTSTSTDLYDFQARSYDPSLGGFTSLDSVAGSAQNPLTLNRYLYANANPATLVDPDGHCNSDDNYSGCGIDNQLLAHSGGPGGEGGVCNASGGCGTAAVVARSKAKHLKNIENASKALGGGYGGMAADSIGPTAAQQAAARNIEDQRDAAAARAAGRPDCQGWSRCIVENAMGGAGDTGRSLWDAFAGRIGRFGGDLGRCVAIADCKDAITSTENTLNIHTVGWCAPLSGAAGIPALEGLGGSFSVGACVVVTGEGDVAILGTGGLGGSASAKGLHGGATMGPVFSTAQNPYDQVGPFDWFSQAAGLVELDTYGGKGWCHQPVQTTYGGEGVIPGISTTFGKSGTVVLASTGAPPKC